MPSHEGGRSRRNEAYSTGRSVDDSMKNLLGSPHRSAFPSALLALLALSGALAIGACDRSAAPTISTPATSPAGQASFARGPAPSDPAPEVPAAKSAPLAATAAVASTAAANTEPAKAAQAFSDLVQRLSEPDAAFFSDNTISNETSYLHVAGQLARTAQPGGAYLGVGPEQNFTYIALTRPRVAFILDIRRQNMLLHLLYKAIFEESTTRSHFLALLLGRPHEAEGAPGASADVSAVIAHAERKPADEATFAASHARLRERIEVGYGIKLDAGDRKTLEVTHREFLKAQLELRFELHQRSGRNYPTLRELLTAADADGARRGFLASEEAFRFVQAMHKEHRIIPVVGDFAGDRAMPGIAAYLKEQKVPVSAFYVSNVEQYLFEPKVWPKWARNVAALPSDEKSLFIRAYLDQGRKHPLQMKGHRTATILEKVADFNARQARKPFETWWAVATEGALPAAPGSLH